VSWQPRILEKFTNAAESVVFNFPLAEYEYQVRQAIRSALTTIPNVPYAVDRRGVAPGVVEVARESLRLVVHEEAPATVDSKVDEMLAKCLTIGRGKLFAIDNADVRRWSWARLAAMPTLQWRAGDIFTKGASLEFDRLSDWAAVSLTTVNQTVTSNNQEWVVANGGSLPAELMVITLTPQTSTGLRPHTITNLTNGYAWTHNRTSSATTQRLRLDTERASVEWSTNSGSSYSNDFTNYTLPTTHAVLAFRLEPGNNTIRYTCTGSPNVTVSFAFYARYP
jgi:hypothetical protein